jgi:hypothetical protein
MHTSELTIRAERVESNFYKPSSWVLFEPSLYEYVSFNIRAYYCVHERLIYFSNRDRIEFKRVESNRVHEKLAHLTQSCIQVKSS